MKTSTLFTTCVNLSIYLIKLLRHDNDKQHQDHYGPCSSPRTEFHQTMQRFRQDQLNDCKNVLQMRQNLLSPLGCQKTDQSAKDSWVGLHIATFHLLMEKLFKNYANQIWWFESYIEILFRFMKTKLHLLFGFNLPPSINGLIAWHTSL